MSKVRTYTKVYPLGHKRKLTLASNTEIGFPADEDDQDEYKHYARIEMAMSIRNPEDEWDAEIGKRIALNRLNHPVKDCIVYAVEFDTYKRDIFITSALIYGQMDIAAAWIKDNQKLFY